MIYGSFPSQSGSLTKFALKLNGENISRNTEKTYLYWIRQYIYSHNKQHPKDLSKTHIEQYLTHLSANRNASGNTQAQALNAIVFLYKQVLKLDVGELDYLRNVRRFKNIPTVLSKEEVALLFAHLRGTTKLMAALLYGSGLRVNECTTLRVQDIDLSLKTITVRNTKGQQARVIGVKPTHASTTLKNTQLISLSSILQRRELNPIPYPIETRAVKGNE